MTRIVDLGGRWYVREAPLAAEGEDGLRDVCAGSDGWIHARVPGDVHLDLVRAGRMPEPLEGRNTHECRWVEDRSWWYRTSFRVEKRMLECDRLEIVFDGILFHGQVFLNGKQIGVARNALVAWRFDAKPAIGAGRNDLVVRVTLGHELVDVNPDAPRRWLRDDVNNFSHPRMLMRMPQFMFGWDWVQALPNVGIWRGVRLEGARAARIADVALRFRGAGRHSTVEAQTIIENLSDFSELACEVRVELKSPSGRCHVASAHVDAQAGRSPVRIVVPVDAPELWWPNGMGPQNLYTVKVTLSAGSDRLHVREFRYGLRTITVDQSKLNAKERRFCIRVNGVDVFCRGGNWIPSDAILARCTPERYDELIAVARDANFNMLRVWGGGIYEDDAFYDACDRLGILVWQDFMFACGLYPDDKPEFREEVRLEAEQVVRRLRHHACIALWCGNNENLWAFKGWWPEQPHNGARVYGEVLPEVCRALDPDRLYWPSSPCGGEHPNCEEVGDCHWWHPATMHPDMKRRVDPFVYDECHAKFVSEYGIIGPPVIQSLRQCVAQEELRRDSEVFQEHTNTFEKNMLWGGIEHHYRSMEGIPLDEYLFYGQMFQSHMYEYSLESLRFREGECQGSLIWMFNDCWLEVGWTPVDYYLRRKPSYYAVKRAFRPVKAIARRIGRDIVVRVSNARPLSLKAQLECGWFRLDGEREDINACKVSLPRFGVKEIGRLRMPARGGFDTREHVFGVLLQADGETLDTTVLRLHPWRQMRSCAPKIRVERRGQALVVQTDTFAHAVHYSDAGKGVLDDNYFDLLPHRPRQIGIVGMLPGQPRLRSCGPKWTE